MSGSLDSIRRRRLLQGGLAAGSLFLPLPWALVRAQSEGATRLVRAPKLALVVGNAAYRHVPPLRNSGNDARAIAAALQACGFEVTLLLDAPRPEMIEAIAAYGRALATRKAVGAFYFAGHGVQLDWRNYLLPVDTQVAKPGDIAAQCVDLTTLIAGLREAANPMNLIVLDACRDNPFGPAAGVQQKGLSQMDAPVRTLLAYATAPGNGADDGLGANGLYTGSLLQEMKVPEARIEDVFKRVRLGVRRASGGRQVPWESTSLEEDFYFVPPEQLRKLSAQEEEREFAEELAVFEGARLAKDAAPIEAYLRRYPSGRFAELAQHRLDLMLASAGERRVEAVSTVGNPFTAGTARADTRFRVGDSFTYDRIDRTLFGKKPERFTGTVTAITEEHVLFNGGEAIRDLLGNQVRFLDGREVTARQDQPLEYSVGKSWSTRYDISRAGKLLGSVAMQFRVVGREAITVPAGTFYCFRIEASGVNRLRGRPDVDLTVVRWDAPGRVRLAVAVEETRRRVVRGHVETVHAERLELVAFEQR
jgi:uncharacterized caspase-like protein